MEKKRELYIDNCRAFAMLLIVFGHCSCKEIYPYIYIWMCSFHVPIFFFTSGMLIAIKNESLNIKKLISKKAKTLLIPYIVFSVLYCVVVKGVGIISGSKAVIPAIKETISLLLSLDGGGTAVWFLPCLFGAEIIFCIERTHLKPVIIALINIFIAVLATILPSENIYVCGLLRIPIGLFFLSAGFLFEKYTNEKWYGYRKEIVSLFLALTVQLSLTYMNGAVDTVRINTGRYSAFYFVNALIASIIIIRLSKKFLNRKLIALTWMGQNTIAILCTHQLVMELIYILDGHTVGLFQSGGAKRTWMLFTMILIINVPITYVLNYIFPCLIGKKA